MTNELEKPVEAKRSGKTNAGIIIFWTGITGIIIGLLISCATFFSAPNVDTPEDWIVIVAGIGFAIASFLIVLIGITLYFVGISQSKKQTNQNVPPA